MAISIEGSYLTINTFILTMVSCKHKNVVKTDEKSLTANVVDCYAFIFLISNLFTIHTIHSLS